MRSRMMPLFLVLVACGSVQRSTRVGAVFGAPDGSRAFVVVERWATVTEAIDDADGDARRHDSLVSSTLYEITTRDGSATRRLREAGWLGAYGFEPGRDVVWLARAPAPERPDRRSQFGLDRRGAEVAAPVGGFEMIGWHLAAAPGLRAGQVAELWDTATGDRATMTEPWPFDGYRYDFDEGHQTLTACDAGPDGALGIAVLEARRAFSGDATGPRSRSLTPVQRDWSCAVSPRGDRAVASFPRRIDVYDLADGARHATISVPLPIQPYVAFAGDDIVIAAGEHTAVRIDLRDGRAAVLDAGCCDSVRRIPTTGAVVASRLAGDRGLYVAPDGTATPLANRHAVEFAAATGLAPWPLAGPTSKLAPLGIDAVVAAGVESGLVVVQLARRDRVLARVTLDDRAP